MSDPLPETNAYGTFTEEPQNPHELSSDCDLIIQNIDGTYSKATPASKYDLKNNEKVKKDNHSQKIRYIVDEEEIMLYSNMRGIPQNVDGFVELYLRHQRYFAIILIIMFLIDLFVGIQDFSFKKETVQQLLLLYKNTKFTSLEWFLTTMLVGESICSLIYYALGILALYRKSVNLYKAFGVFAVVGVFFQMILAYVNKFNFVIFLMRFVGLIYSRFLSQILMSLLIVPRYSTTSN